MLTRAGLATESLINGLAKSLPHFLFNAAIHGNALRFCLPAVLQGLDRIDSQKRGSTQLLCLCNQSLAASSTGFLSRFQRRRSIVQGLLPKGLQFCKGFLTQMTR